MNAISPPLKGPQAVVEYVRSLSAEEKDAALSELVREAIRQTDRPHLLAVTAPDGEALAVLVPQALAATSLKAYIPTLTPEQRAAMEAAIADPTRTFEMSDFLKRVSREDTD